MSIVDKLVKEALSTKAFKEPEKIEKTASTEMTPSEIAEELEKLAYSGNELGAPVEMSLKEKIVQFAAMHEAITGQSILKGA